MTVKTHHHSLVKRVHLKCPGHISPQNQYFTSLNLHNKYKYKFKFVFFMQNMTTKCIFLRFTHLFSDKFLLEY